MINILSGLKNELESLKIPYYFDNWEDELELPYLVGELSEVPTLDEDGKREFSFTLTGEDVNSYINLFNYNEIIRNEYKYVKKIKIDGGLIGISYENIVTVPVETKSIKRIQINMTIYLWEDK